MVRGVAPFAGLNTSLSATVGDSWYGAGNPPYSGYYMGFYYNANPAYPVYNYALGGQGINQIVASSAAIITSRAHVVSMSVGRNDFMNDFYGLGYTNAQLYDRYITDYLAAINNLKTNLPGVKIVVETITERSASDGVATGYNALFNSYRPTLNNQIRAWQADGTIAAVVEIGGSLTLGAVGAMTPGGTYSTDGLHLNEGTPGHGTAAPIFADTLNRVYSGLPQPIITRTSAVGAQLRFSIATTGYIIGYYWRVQVAGNAAFTTPLSAEGAIRDGRRIVTITDTTDDDLDGIIETDPFDEITLTMPAGATFVRICLCRESSDGLSFVDGMWSNYVNTTIV